jgi:elongation factor Ts
MTTQSTPRVQSLASLRDEMVAVAKSQIQAPEHAGEPSVASPNLFANFRISQRHRLLSQLREITGAGVVECNKALEASNGDLEMAKANLGIRMRAKAGKLEANDANVIVVGSYVHHDGSAGALAKLATQTDFVARTDEIKSLARDIAMHVVATGTTTDAVLDEPWVRDNAITVREKIAQVSAKVGEKIEVKEVARI